MLRCSVSRTSTRELPKQSGATAFFWPLGPAFAQSRLRVGECKFSGRMVAFNKDHVSNVAVVIPAASSKWNRGTSQRIDWTYPDDVFAATIELLKDGAVVTTIASGISPGTGGNGATSWTVSSGIRPGNDYRVRVRGLRNDGVYIAGVSTPFSIVSDNSPYMLPLLLSD